MPKPLWDKDLHDNIWVFTGYGPAKPHGMGPVDERAFSGAVWPTVLR